MKAQNTVTISTPTPTELEESLRLELFRSLTRIQRHLSRRDPQALRRISEWYSKSAVAAAAAETAGADAKNGKRRLRRCRSLRQRRMEQNEIDNSLLEYLKIPKGIATRGLLLPRQPDWIFSDSADIACGPSGGAGSPVGGFSWLEACNSNVNNQTQSSIMDSSRRLLEREVMRQKLDLWVFLYFRVLRRNWESTIVEEKKTAPDVNMYAEENICKWTVKLRFKIMRQIPVKVALRAFMSRLGLESNAAVVFCRDGFYGLMDVGNAYGDLSKTPCAMIGFNSTPRYLGLKNGDSIFVNSCSVSQRQLMEEAPRQDLGKKYRRPLSVESEEGEFDFDVCSEDDDQDQDQHEDL